MSFAEILPLAFVMIAGPQIVSSFFLAASEGWAKNSLAYVAGAAVAVTSDVCRLRTSSPRGAKHAAGSEHSTTVERVLDSIVLALMLFLIVRVYLTRRTSHPPKWMGRLQTATPKFALILGLLLLGIFPTQCLPFVELTLFFLGFPSLAVAVLGERAKTTLPKVRDWMNRDAWVINEIVLVFFAVLTINSLAGG